MRLRPCAGQYGLSVEQRKRLTIAVELVANPSIVFMDEPTSGLDARAAAIVMRTVRNTVDTGRTVVCTIHQPSIDIFEVRLPSSCHGRNLLCSLSALDMLFRSVIPNAGQCRSSSSYTSVLRLQAFDELLLMKRGGRIIFFGETGYRSQKLVEYFEVHSPLCCASWRTKLPLQL